MLHFAIFSFSRNKIINKLCKQKIINLNLIIFSLIFKLGFNHINNKNLKNRMTHSLDYSLYQIEEKESLNCSKNEIEHNNSFDPNLDNKINEIKIFNEIKKILNFNEPNYDCKDINDEERYFICKDKTKDLNKNNLEINDISEGYEILNQAFEDLDVGKADLCVIDAFPGVDIEEINKKADKIADNVVII